MAVNDVHDGAEPLVLGAVPIKSELIEEVQRDHPKVHETISSQWRETVDALSEATEVVVIGYSFPAEDAYGRFLLSEAVRKRPPNMELPEIRYYSLQKDRDQLEKTFREIFSCKVNYKYEGEVKPASQPDC